jgi:flagellar L-ring protein precursor FlgH
VIEVKPNGTLVLESKTVVRSDNEEQVITLSGICRPDDISQTNTVQSSQMFGLDLNIQNAGDIKNTANKGVIPRVLDALFNF